MKEQKIDFNWVDEQGINIAAVEWPVNSPIAVIGFIHGLGEHIHRYEHYAHWFNTHSVACIGYDRQGHGRSGGKRGFAKSYNRYLDEVAHLTTECDRRYPGTPLFLYGHSMGGQILLRYLIRRHPQITGAIVSAPHIRLPNPPPKIEILLGKVMRVIKPDFTRPAPIDVSLLSRHEQVVQNYQDDPLVHSRISAQTAIDMLNNAAGLDSYAGGITTPTLLIHGTADGITSAQGSKEFAQRNSPSVTYRAIEGAYHEVHNDPEWEQTAEMVRTWMKDQNRQ